eukprot:COSAG01_NODE_4533_length_4947_cov_72.545173_6_plen_41_part_01
MDGWSASFRLVAMLHVSVTVLPCSVLLSGWCSQDELKLSGW